VIVAVGVGHGMGVKVLVGNHGIGVMVGVLVDVAVGAGVLVLVGVTVEVGVGVDVAVPVDVGVNVAVLVDVEVGVSVGVFVSVGIKVANVGVSVTKPLVGLTTGTGVEMGVTVAVWVAGISGPWTERFAKSATIIATTPPLPIRGTMTYRIHHLIPLSSLSPAILTSRDAILHKSLVSYFIFTTIETSSRYMNVGRSPTPSLKTLK